MSRRYSVAGAWRVRALCVYAVSLVAIAALACWGAAGLFQRVAAGSEAFLLADQSVRASTAPVSHGRETSSHVTLTQDWLDRIRSNDFWTGGGGPRGGGGPSVPYTSRSNLSGPSRPEPPSRTRFDAAPRNRDREEMTYRTVCVRQCDGYFWPISFATSEAHFKRDRAVCERSCTGARLYIYRNPGSEPETMRDLDGQPYTKLPSAFLFRTRFEPSCKCNPHPWEQEAKDRHRVYALEDQRRQENKVGSKVATLQAAQSQAPAANARRTEVQRQKAQQQARNTASPANAGPVVTAAALAADAAAPIKAPRAPEKPPVQPPAIVGAAPPLTPKAPAGPAPHRPRPAGIMSAGVGNRSNGNSGGRIPPSSNPSGPATNWISQAFPRH